MKNGLTILGFLILIGISAYDNFFSLSKIFVFFVMSLGIILVVVGVSVAVYKETIKNR